MYQRCEEHSRVLNMSVSFALNKRINYPCLTDYCNYKAWDIAMLTDDSPDPRQRPTRKNIIDAMTWLVNDAQSGDTLLFFCTLFRYPRPFS